MTKISMFLCAVLLLLPHVASANASQVSAIRPVAPPPATQAGASAEITPDEIPKARWDHRPAGAEWTRSALIALKKHGAPLVETVPEDIAVWCPGYPTADAEQRRAFWVGFLSALSKHESTYRATAVGGGGLWFGLLQILPSTARGYGCNARSSSALTDGGANLSCAIRIMASTVPRDGAIATKNGRWAGVASDWGPMRSEAKRADMQSWLREQSYCAVTQSPRPQPRAKTINAQLSTMNRR